MSDKKDKLDRTIKGTALATGLASTAAANLAPAALSVSGIAVKLGVGGVLATSATAAAPVLATAAVATGAAAGVWKLGKELKFW